MVAEARVGRGQGVEVVGEANVLGQTQAPPQGDGLRVAVGQKGSGQGAEGGDSGAGGQELQGAVTVVGNHGPPRGAPEGDLVAGAQRGQVAGKRPLGDDAHQQLEDGLVPRSGQDAVRAPSIAEAFEVRLDANELAGVEPERCAVDDLEADADRSRRGEGGHRCHRCPAAVAAVAEPFPLRRPQHCHGLLVRLARGAARDMALEVPGAKAGPALFAARLRGGG